jgi:hypothetical protein
MKAKEKLIFQLRPKAFFKKPQNLSKCPTLMKKYSIYLEIILKSLEFFKKASILLKRSIEKASDFLLKPPFL